ncbi:MAG TPA: cytochrome-c oxidase, cbb3-type subunit II [Dongiaceae bacterium]|jgi:cytochrome c oxidase cbb3-type subunit 2
MAFRHELFEKNSLLLLVGILITVSIGGIVQMVPLATMDSTIEKVEGVRPYSPLELAGRNIYIREGCYNCHSQQVRPFRDEVDRYGHYSLAAESRYDHPFQWGSKRTGPDLARVGGKYSNEWQVEHLVYPQGVVPGSVMPPYPFLAGRALNFDDAADHLRTLRIVGVPYDDAMVESALGDLRSQADPDADNAALLTRYPKAVVANFDGDAAELTEMDALVAYLQVLGTLADFSTYDESKALR